MLVNRLLGTEELPSLAQLHLRKVLTLGMLISFLMSLSNTFGVLYAIDKIGYTLAATCTSIMLLTQLIFDYPSGSLGDWIGQRWVLAIAFSCYSFTFFLLISANSFMDFAFLNIINGFGNAQSSGAFETWVDNNYREMVGENDLDRRIYGFTMGRISSLTNLSLGASFLIGGALSTTFDRPFVFRIQFILALIVVVLIVIFIKDFNKKSTTTLSHSSLRDYLNFLVGGFKFLLSNRVNFFFIIGLSFYNVTWLIWGTLILFPIYFGYTGSDILASTLRTVLFFVGIPVSFFMANVIKKISNKRLNFFIFLQIILFFPSFIVLTHFIPPNNQFNPIGILGTFLLLATLVGLVFDVSRTLSQRILLDLIPSNNRNAVYSLMPSIVSFIGIFILPFAGSAVDNFGLPIGIFIAGLVCIFSLFLLLQSHFASSSPPNS